MKQVVINVCYGGFGLSPKGIKRWAKYKGRKCYFFEDGIGDKPYKRITMAQATEKRLFWSAFDIPDPDSLKTPIDWHSMTDVEKDAYNQEYEKHSLWANDIPRDDPDLIRVVKELGSGHRTGASGDCSELKIVEIPDNVDYTIEEYDGNEHIAEVHRTWG